MVQTRSGSTRGRGAEGASGSEAASAPAAGAGQRADTAAALFPSYLLPNLLLTVALLAAPAYLFSTLKADVVHVGTMTLREFVQAQLGLSFLAFLGVVYMVNVMSDFCRRKKQCGLDLCKKGTPAGEIPIPESQGLSPGVIYLVSIIGCQLLYARKDPESLADYNSSLLSICFMLFLGFIDDVLDLPWRYKLVLPPIASLPLLCSYNGSTAMLVPRPFRPLLWSDGQLTMLSRVLNVLVTVDNLAEGKIMELGWVFMLYMALLAVFCTNAINIYAGINGLEAGQALVIAVGILTFQLLDLGLEVPYNVERSNQVFTITLILPFIAVVLGLLYHNFYPARAFVGDTFCYFAGMTFAVVGIHGHFSKTLVFFFVPQIINFLLSCPQLFKVIPCPRHRLPRFDAELGKLRPSICPCRPDEYRLFKRFFGLAPDEEYFINFTLINVVLRLAGPLHERTLCIVLLTIQAVSSALALFIRFYMVHVFV